MSASFEKIKSAITTTPILRNPKFSKDFILYTYEVEKSIVTVLTKKEDKHNEHPIAFFSQTLHGAKDRYGFIEK